MIKATYIDHMGSDLSVVNAARVSFGKKHDEFKEGDEGLIKYLGSHGHFSPFGHCFATFHVEAPVFVRAQCVKHEYLRLNEISRRYVDSAPTLFVPDTWREASKDKKQGSGGRHHQSTNWTLDVAEANAGPLKLYEWMIREGVAPEQARMVLPQSMMTEWYWSGSMDAFANMCNLRCKEDTQQETRDVANQIDEVMADLYPHSWKALRNES